MKQKIILGFLVLVVLLFFLAQSWALDWKRAQQQYYEHPVQELDRIPVIPQNPGDYPSLIKFILLPGTQNLPTLILIENSKNVVQPKAGNAVTEPVNPGLKPLIGQDER